MLRPTFDQEQKASLHQGDKWGPIYLAVDVLIRDKPGAAHISFTHDKLSLESCSVQMDKAMEAVFRE